MRGWHGPCVRSCASAQVSRSYYWRSRSTSGTARQSPRYHRTQSPPGAGNDPKGNIFRGASAHRRAIALTLYFGFRKGEVFRLELRHVDFDLGGVRPLCRGTEIRRRRVPAWRARGDVFVTPTCRPSWGPRHHIPDHMATRVASEMEADQRCSLPLFTSALSQPPNRRARY